jgi:hypothetical protein
MGAWTSYLTADTLGELCFGASFGMLENDENRFVVKTMCGSARLSLIVSSLRVSHKIQLTVLIQTTDQLHPPTPKIRRSASLLPHPHAK